MIKQKQESSSFLKKRTKKLLVVLALALTVESHALAQIRSITTDRTQRDFGYFPGGLISSTAVIHVGPDTTLQAGSLPQTGPVSTDIDLRKATTQEAAESGGRRITVRTEWQSFATPEEVSRIDIPGYQLIFIKDQARLTANIPGFSIAVSPFRHDLQPVLDPSVLRPDHPVAPIDLARDRQQLYAASALALVAALAVIASRGLLPWAGRKHAPFADAARRISRDRAGGRDALLLLHRAFDSTAGERVLADDLDRFLASRPRFRPLRAEIENFFAESRRMFFDSTENLPSPAVTPWARLSRALARAERR
jgi:mxaA protein